MSWLDFSIGVIIGVLFLFAVASAYENGYRRGHYDCSRGEWMEYITRKDDDTY